MKSSDAEYEKLVSDIVAGIRQSVPELHDLEQGYNYLGHHNRIDGKSGYKHQIDVSLKGMGRIFLFECKCWDKSIGVAEVLILAGRKNDIKAHYPEHEVTASMVSTKKASRNVTEKFAKHFGIEIEIATSPYEYGLRIGQNVHHALNSRVHFTDDPTYTLTRNGVQI